MDLYRIAPKKFLSVLNGLGASYLDGGRWNESGDPVIFFATSPSVAMLEMGNYLSSPRLMPDSYRLAHYRIADSLVEKVRHGQLPAHWNNFPYPKSTQAFGSAWLRTRKNVILRVPSTAVPGGLEDIAIYNPRHSKAKGLKLITVFDKIYNDRLFSQG